MDTQGLFELERSPLVDAKIFGISSFLSSIQIMNLNDVIQENELEYLKMVTDFTKIALKRQNDKSYNSLSKPFQNLLFLVRDWRDEDVGFGYEGGTEYLNIILNVNGENTEAQTVRNNIKNTYENVRAFLMPPPGKIGSRNYNGSLSKLEPEFVEYLQILIEELLSSENLVVKKIFDKEITGNDLMNYAAAILLAYQSPELPEIDSIFNIAVKSEMKKLSDIVYEKYTMNISQSTYFEETNFEERLSNDHKKYQQIAVDEFIQMPKIGDETTENMYKNFIINQTDTFFLKWKHQAMKTHVDMMSKQIDKLNAEINARKYFEELLKLEQKNADLKLQVELKAEKIRMLNSPNFRRGLVICKMFSFGFGECGKMSD